MCNVCLKKFMVCRVDDDVSSTWTTNRNEAPMFYLYSKIFLHRLSLNTLCYLRISVPDK